MDHIWDAIIAVITGVVGMFAWVARKYTDRIDGMDRRITELEKTTAVVESKLQDMKEDLTEIKAGIRHLVEDK